MINERIKKLRLNLNLTQKEFGNQIGLKSSISEIELGHAPITDRTIISICLKFNVSEDWIRFGKGEMFVSKNKDFFETFDNLADPLQTFLISLSNSLLENQK